MDWAFFNQLLYFYKLIAMRCRCQIFRIKIGKKCPGSQYSSYDRLEVLIWTRLKSAFRNRLNFSNILSNMEDTATFSYDIV